MARIFLDIGAHEGQTLEVVTQPKWRFDEIHSFEPMPGQFAKLDRFSDDERVTLHNFGLSDKTGSRDLYGANEQYEASVYRAPGRIDDSVVTTAEFVRASDWMAENVSSDDVVLAKMNCEGSEADILLDLIETDEIWKLDHVAIAFDIRRFPGGERRYAQLRRLLEEINFPVHARWVMLGAAVPPGEEATYEQMIGHDWFGQIGWFQ
jgi:FkbM family methyltransferase